MNVPGSIAVYRSGAVGDVIVMLPVLQALREAWPPARITLVAPSEVGNLALVSGWADRLFSPESAWVRRWFTGDAAQVRSALGEVDALLAFTNDTDGELERTARLAGIREVLIHRPFPPNDAPVHMTDYLLSALQPWGITRRGMSPLIRLSDEMIAAGRAVLARSGIAPEARFVVVHTGSSTQSKNWPDMPRFVALVTERLSVPVLLQRGPVEAERGIGDEWPSEAPLVGPLPLGTLAGLLSLALAYVGNDAGPSHLAAALGVPTVTVFGRRPGGGTSATQWSPRGPRAHHVVPEGGSAWPSVEAVLKQVLDALGW